jgi:MYXO-CTERM domain-containing protein
MKMIQRIAKGVAMLTLAAVYGIPNAAAWPNCTGIFTTTYPSSQTENLGSCQTCHQASGGGNNFNAYGVDLRSNGAAGADSSCSNINFVAALAAVEFIDSDGEGNNNLVEIQASTQPGWCDTAQSTSCTNSPGTPPNVVLDPAPSNNGIPVAVAGGPYAGEAGTTLIQFDGSGSSDPDGDTLTYAWDFGDSTSATGMMPTHTYTSSGGFRVTLVVNDSKANSDPGTATATISAPPINIGPTANPGGPYSGGPGKPVTFDGSASSDPNGDPLTYAWDFGDGAMASGRTPTHTFAAAGTYTVSLTVNDGQLDSMIETTTTTITAPVDQSDGAVLYESNCLGCHGDPWNGPPIDDSLSGLRRVAGARACNIRGSIFGTSVFPNGVPEMQFLQGMSSTEIDAMAEHLNSQQTSGEQRYVSTCAGCHGNDGSGGRVGEGVGGESAHETFEAIAEEREMLYLACMPKSDIDAITDFLVRFGGGDDDDDDGGGSADLPLLALLAAMALFRRRRKSVEAISG